MPDRDEQNTRYRAGLCVGCGLVPHSAGRPRCDECHRTHGEAFEPELQRREKVQQRGA